MEIRFNVSLKQLDCPAVIYILLFLFVLDTPKQGSHHTAVSVTAPQAFQHLHGSHVTAPIACDGLITFGLWLDGSIIVLFTCHCPDGGYPAVITDW